MVTTIFSSTVCNDYEAILEYDIKTNRQMTHHGLICVMGRWWAPLFSKEMFELIRDCIAFTQNRTVS